MRAKRKDFGSKRVKDPKVNQVSTTTGAVLLAQIQAAAEAMGVTASTWLRQAAEEKLMRQITEGVR